MLMQHNKFSELKVPDLPPNNYDLKWGNKLSKLIGVIKEVNTSMFELMTMINKC